MKINEVIIDNERGLGSVPYNQEVNYKGLRVDMKPSIFLKLANYVSKFTDRMENIKELIKKGTPIGSPFLYIEIPDEWKTGNLEVPADVSGHEGRHRMFAILRVEGDEPIETHLFFPTYNRDRIKPEWINQINKILVSQDGDSLAGPFFTLK